MKLLVIRAVLVVSMLAGLFAGPAAVPASAQEAGAALLPLDQPAAGVEDFFLNENFEYGSAAGDLTAVSGGNWVAHSGAATNPIQYVLSSLTVPDYISSDIGGAATFGTTGEDVNRVFGSVASGNLYYSALVRIGSAKTAGDYFLHFKNDATGFAGRLFARSSGTDLQFGIGTTGTPVWSGTNYSFNATYLVVVKVEVATSPALATSALYILETCESEEPSAPLVSATGTMQLPQIGIAIRQGNASNAPIGTVDGIRVGTTWEETVLCAAAEPEVSISKSVSPAGIVDYHGVVTYTVSLTNSSPASDPSVVLTDTLPAEVDFESWVTQPAGAVVTGDQITWAGEVAGESVTSFVFRAVHTGGYGDLVVNTAEFDGTLDAGTAEASFNVEETSSDITFVYHDLEDVVQPGEQLFLAGDFNGWSASATPMTGDPGNTVFSVTVPGLTTGSTYEYKYVVISSGENWDWLQTDNRSLTVVSTGTQDDYRNVIVNWVNLQWPPTIVATAFEQTESVYGQVYIPNITNPAGQGRGLRAEVGFGTSADLTSWTWFPMSFNLDVGNNDEFVGTMLPTASGVFSYTARYDGNWGLGNPNAAWVYGDLDGSPFQLSKTGEMTVSLFDIGINKVCPPSPVLPGSTVVYTITYDVADALVTDVIITDTLPADVTYVTDTSGLTPSQPEPGTLVWNFGGVDLDGSFVVTGVVSPEPAHYNLTNNVWVSGSNDAISANNSDTCTSQGTIPTGPVSIYDIQFTTDPGDGTYPSPMATEVVTTTGTVCAVLGSYFVVTEAPGAWHSIIVYNGSQAKPAVGTRVLVSGTVTEYYGLTEFSFPIYLSQGTGDPVCDYTTVNTAIAPFDNAALSEPYESVLVNFPLVTITSNNLTGRNGFTDSAGGQGRWSDWGYFPSPRPAVGTQYEYLRGPLVYTFNEYRVMPPTAADAYLLDVVIPSVLSTDPIIGAVDVNVNKPISAVFSEELDPSTVNETTFFVTGPLGNVAGVVTYDNNGFVATFTPDSPLNPLTFYSATVTTGIKDPTGNSLAADYIWGFTTGALDTTPPNITDRFPAPGAVDAPLSLMINITFDEDLNPATVVPANFQLVGPFGNVPWDIVTYDSVLHQVTLNPTGLLLPTTTYTLIVSEGLTDWAGFAVPADQRTWSFTTQVEPPMNAYLGDLHNHTGYSDGSGNPQQAFSTGQAAGLDFMAIADHSYSIDDAEWLDTLAQANAFNVDGVFVTLRGFEYTQGGEGHANVYNTVRHAVRTDTTATCTYCDYTPNLETGVTVDGFYHWLSVTGTVSLDGNGTMMEFNHPGWINFNDWRYHPEVQDTAVLEEVGNGWGSSYVFSWDEFIRSLDYGWKIAATNNTDNHTASWGTIGENRTGVVMPALTRENLLDALKARRTYATEDANAQLFFKANGYWMGTEIPNSGSMMFHVWGSDPDGELIDRVELVTYGGEVIATYEPDTSSFDWQFSQDIAPGSHYYLILLTQADGDRLVSSPVWTQGTADVRITDLTIQPSLPTIYNPNLVSARITNRGTTTETLTINFEIGGDVIGTEQVTLYPCTVGPCADAYATISWQPLTVGEVTLTAHIADAPVTDSPDDNSRSLFMEVTDQHIPLVLIDTGHNNIGVDPHGISQFVNDMTLHGYNVLFNLDELTASDLVTDTVKLLILNAYGPSQFTPDEMEAIADYVAGGGSIWMNSMSDYTSKVTWAHDLAPRMNALVTEIEDRVGELIPIRFNDDEVLDGNDNNGYPWGILWHNFPVSDTTGIGMNVMQMQSWSDSSLMDRSGGALTEADLGENAFLMVVGDQDTGNGTFGEPNRTHNTDAEGPGYPTGDAYIYQPGTDLPAGAGIDLNGTAGRLLFYTDSNDPFNVFAYVAGDGKQNELFNLEVVMWLLGEPLQLETIAEARYDAELDDTPENLDRLVWVEGVVTASYGEFFDVVYIEDVTGGITVFAPAGTASGAIEPEFDRGDCVRVVGTVDVYQGDTEIQFFETEQIYVLEDQCVPASEFSLTGSMPIAMTTFEASQEANEGWLVVVSGTVTSKVGSDTIWLDDGSGPVRLFLDGYNGTWDDVEVGNHLLVAGLTSEDGFGQRIRVRNHNMHPGLPDDVMQLPQIEKTVTPDADIQLGGLVTYTLTLINNGSAPLSSTAIEDILPEEVDFDSWVSQNGALVSNDVVTWNGTVMPDDQVVIIFRATVVDDPANYGQTVVNVVTYDADTFGTGEAQASFTVQSALADLSVSKAVTPEIDVPLGGIVTYTLSLENTGVGMANDVDLTDVLPEEVTFDEWVVQNGAQEADGTITWSGDVSTGTEEFVFTAIVTSDPLFYSHTITNTVTFDSSDAGSGSAQAAFTIEDEPLIPHLTIVKSASPTDNVPLGGQVTYTITLDSSGNAVVENVEMTDVLPVEVDFGEWIEQPAGASQSGGTITFTGDIPAQTIVELVFTADVGTDPAYSGVTVTNTASFESDNAGTGSDQALFVIEELIPLPDLAVEKTAAPVANVLLGGSVTYTITLTNSGEGLAEGVVLTDVLPAEVDFGEWVVQPAGASVALDVITWEGDLPADDQIQLVFTVDVPEDPTLYGVTVTNTVEFDSSNGGTGSDQAVFVIVAAPVVFYIFLPIAFR